MDDESHDNTALKKLAEDFVQTAEDYGRIIINEFDPEIYKYKPEEIAQNESLKQEIERRIAALTIKPDTTLGGVAGGVKFKHNGILFKFALAWVRHCHLSELHSCSGLLRLNGVN